MTQLYKKFFKLNNGEDIICCTDDSCENINNKSFINIVDPVVIHNIRIPRAGMVFETFMMKPWIPFSDDTVVTISTNAIVALVEPNKRIIEQYDNFILSRKEETEEVIEEANNSNPAALEELLANAFRSKDEHEEEDDQQERRTLH